MGRGRAKAKQQKVARELKYNTHFTDLDALQRELGVSQNGSGLGPAASDGDEREDDPDGEWVDGDWTGTDR
jgi:Protein of unknown function (DUF3073)